MASFYSDPQQYRLHAYVCGKACVQRIDQPATVSFTWIYQKRPQDCRYAVAGQWNYDLHGENIVVWDLFRVQRQLDGTLIVPKPHSTHTDVDAAIMATAMTYEED